MDKGASLRDRATAASQSSPQAVSSIAGIPSAELAIEACRLGVIYDDMIRAYAGPVSEYGALLGGEMPNIDAAYDAWASAARRAVGAPVLPLPGGAPGA